MIRKPPDKPILGSATITIVAPVTNEPKVEEVDYSELLRYAGPGGYLVSTDVESVIKEQRNRLTAEVLSLDADILTRQHAECWVDVLYDYLISVRNPQVITSLTTTEPGVVFLNFSFVTRKIRLAIYSTHAISYRYINSKQTGDGRTVDLGVGEIKWLLRT